MQWTWTYECDFQLLIFVPIFIVCYNKVGKTATKFLLMLMFVAGVLTAYHSAYKYNITAGILSMNNE